MDFIVARSPPASDWNGRAYNMTSLSFFFYIFSKIQGALVIIGANTAVQPLVGTLFQLMFLLFVLKLAPYEGDEEDLAAFWSSLALTLTSILSVMLLYELNTVADSKYFHPDSIGTVMIAVNVCCLVMQISLMAKTKLQQVRADKSKLALADRTTAVVPADVETTEYKTWS